jgi:hypothetical protein
MAQTKQQQRQEARRRQPSGEFFSPVQLARLLGLSAWTLTFWRKKGLGPPWWKLSSHTIRYGKQAFDVWLASLRQNERPISKGEEKGNAKFQSHHS